MAPTRHRTIDLGSLALIALLPACSADTPRQPLDAKGSEPALARAGYDTPGAHRQYGTPVKLGNGKARVYVVLDSKAAQAPLEVGIALDERALEGLPTSHATLDLPMALPTHSPLPYRSVVLNWNPQGHIPDGVYNVPHFDFHFYFTTSAEVATISPSDPKFADKANNLPTGDYVPQFYILPVAPGDAPVTAAEPNMGIHWVDVRSPELQGLLGKPAEARPFSHTFIYGSWNGRFTFVEPMVTRDFLLSRPDALVPISQPARYPEAGWYPSAYRVTYDPQAKEYRVGLAGLSSRD